MVPTPGRPPARPIAPTSVDQVLRQVPSLQTNAAQFMMDSRMGAVRFTAAARAFDNQGWYLGTSGLGLMYLQDATAIPERVPFGLPARFVGAVISWPGGLWAATNRTVEADAAFTFVESELREFRTVRGLPATGTPFDRVIELAGRDKLLWAATDFGLARIDPEDGRIELFDERRGLPHSRVLDVAGRQGRVVIGTLRGVASMDDSLRLTRVAPRFADAAYAVFPAGDSIWVGTPAGVFLALPGEDDLERPPGLGSASLQAPVYGFSLLGDTLVALTRDQLIWRDPRSKAWSLGPNLSGLLGRLRRFAPDGSGFWVAGDRGVGFVRLNGSPIRALREGDLPGPANDLAVDREHLWVGTENGLVRFRLDAVRP
jgi:ligand-binding sensor domain-containing protein